MSCVSKRVGGDCPSLQPNPRLSFKNEQLDANAGIPEEYLSLNCQMDRGLALSSTTAQGLQILPVSITRLQVQPDSIALPQHCFSHQLIHQTCIEGRIQPLQATLTFAQVLPTDAAPFSLVLPQGCTYVLLCDASPMLPIEFLAVQGQAESHMQPERAWCLERHQN